MIGREYSDHTPSVYIGDRTGILRKCIYCILDKNRLVAKYWLNALPAWGVAMHIKPQPTQVTCNVKCGDM